MNFPSWFCLFPLWVFLFHREKLGSQQCSPPALPVSGLVGTVPTVIMAPITKHTLQDGFC